MGDRKINKKIDCQLRNAEYLEVVGINVCAHTKPKFPFLELGSFRGGSAHYLIKALNHENRNRELWCVDPYDNPQNYLNADPEELKKSLNDILSTYGNCRHFEKTSDDFFKEAKGRHFSLILIDGLHTPDQMRRDLDHSIEHLAPGGVIFVDDIDWVPDFSQYVKERCKRFAIEWIRSEGKIIQAVVFSSSQI